MKLYPRSLTGQIAVLIALALFVAQAINFALLVGQRRELRFEQAVRPSVVRLVDAAERLSGGRPLARADGRTGRPWRGRPQLLAANPVRPEVTRLPEVEAVTANALRNAGIAHGRIAAGVRPVAPGDPRSVAEARYHGRRAAVHGGELTIAVELPGRGWLSVRAGWGRDGWGLVWRLIGQTLILYGVILLPVLWLGRRISRPLRGLTAAVRRFGAGGGDVPLAESGPADVRALIAAYNALDLRVRGMLDEKDRMLGAIGHDLRTPLAALRVRIESVDDETHRIRMVDTIDEMSRTLDDILSLARLGRPSEPATAVDVAALVDAVVDDFRDLGAAVTMAESDRIVRTLRPGLMRRAVRNLIENAVKYGGGAEVSVGRDGGAVRIAVADRGPGIPAGQHDQVFDAFTRLEQSRNRDSGGVGLGLALARGIVREAGGEITLGNRPGGGLLAEISLPDRP